MSQRSSHSNTAVVIIGAGLSGMCTAIDLIRRTKSRDFIIVDKGSQVGGTWNDNKYPGCCCDVWSHLYSFSFDANPNWTKEYPGQEEIRSYLIGVAERWGLFRHLRFNTAVEEASWDDQELKWKVKVNVSGEKDAEFGSGYTITSDFLVSGVGQLNSPRYPQIPGLEDFKGKMMHSARWDWSYDFAGKKVGIIGNGATSAQIIPEVAKVCESLTVFQRTPNWVFPRGDAPISDTMQAIYRYVPPVRKRYRAKLMDVRESFYDAAAVDDSAANNFIRQETLKMMEQQIPDSPELRAKLTPDYPPGCKRVLISDDFFQTMNLPQVKLETRPIKEITQNGVNVDGQDYDFDLIVLATGFRTLEFMYPIKIHGVNGRSIEDIWKGGARAYLGVTVESLPNFGMLYGPNTNLGHNSIILMIEAQSRYINSLIRPVLQARVSKQSLRLLPKQERIETYNAEIQNRLRTLTFASPKCSSWYKNEAGLVTNNWCGTVIEYQKVLSELDWDDFDISGSRAEVLLSGENKQHLGRVVEESTFPFLAFGTAIAALAVLAKVASTSPAVHKALARIRA